MKWKLILGRATLAIAVPAVFLIVLELLLRFATTGSVYLFETNPHYGDSNGVVRLRPNQSTWWYGCHYQVNSAGFRMPHELTDYPGMRILALGDSITLGMGVRKTEDVWPNRLESILREKGYGSVEVINSGVQAWNLMTYDAKTNLVTAEFTRFVSEMGPVLKPKIVVYCICLNDVPSQTHAAFEMDNSQNKARFAWFPEQSREWLKRKALYRLARDSYRESRFRKLDFSALSAAPEEDAFWEQVSQELGNLKKTVEALDAKLYCIIVPFSYQLLPANQKLLSVNRRWQAALDGNRIPWKELTGQFTPDNVLQFFSLGDYIHLNAAGHRLVADEAFQLIENQVSAQSRNRASSEGLRRGSQDLISPPSRTAKASNEIPGNLGHPAGAK